MTRAIRIDEEAEAELSEAVAWYEAQVEGLGGEFLAAVHEALGQVLQNPRRCSLAPDLPEHLGVRRTTLKRFPYAIVFLILPAEIRVLAFAHTSRRPAYWLDREPLEPG